MKTKYLFGMLLSGAMLAACSTEDDLNLSKKQEVNPSAPVFTVSFEDNDALDTRASMNDKAVLTFDETDKMSLFHGMPVAATSGWQNAVYSVSTNDGAGVFTTPSIVNEGYAVMIYPADTEFNNKLNENKVGAAAPAIIIPADQDENTKLKTPFMSAYVNIKDGKNDTGVAGYEKEYDIALKRVGTTLFLALDVTDSEKLNTAIESEGVDPIGITKVEFDAGTEKAFTTAISVMPADGSYEDHKTWIKKSIVDTKTAPTTTGLAEGIDAQSQTLTTTDLGENKDKATFTLLPVINIDESGKVSAGSTAKIVVYTTYGTVTLAAADEVWYKGDVPSKVQEGLNSILDNKNIYKKPTSSKNFPGEEAGVYMNRTIAVDMSNLKMNGLHVQSGKQLVDAFKVFNAFSSEESATFYLDGVDKGTFTMTAAQLAEVQKLNTEGKVTLTPCNKETTCTTVQITGGNETEIPNLSFGGDVVVKLAGKWTYTAVEDDEPLKEFEKVTSINIVKGAVLTLENYIEASTEEGFTAPKIVVEEGADVKISGIAVLRMNMSNSGTITIPEGPNTYRLIVDDNVTLINNEAKGDKVNAFSKGGKIENGGVLGIVDKTTGVINNYGEIILTSDEARTLITANQKGTGLAAAFAAGTNYAASEQTTDVGNAIGSIVLYEKTGGNNNTVVKDENKQGFIKLELDKSKVGSTETGTIANYIILAGDCASVNETNKEGLMVKTGSQGNVKYIEIQSSKEVVFGNATQTDKDYGALQLEALIIPAGKSVNIPKEIEVDVKQALYVKGGVTRAGTFDYGTTISGHYFGGDANDKNNIISTGSN